MHVLTGDQGNASTLNRWLEESGGAFDAILDDGAHTNRLIKASFDVLWPALRPGGVYFLEDLHIGRHARWDDTQGGAAVSMAAPPPGESS